MKKVIRDGKVAVLYSPRFGAGWSTWNSQYPELLFMPEIVALVEEDKRHEIKGLMNKTYGEDLVYCGGCEDLEIEWIPIGTEFYVHDYDGNETIKYRDSDSDEWTEA